MNQEILTLKRSTTEIRSVLFRGTVLRHGEPWIAVAREVIRPSTHVSGDSVVFELIRSPDVSKPSLIEMTWKAIRPESLGMSLFPCIAVFVYGWHQGWAFSSWIAIFSILGALALHISVNVLNDVEDYVRLLDLPGSRGGSGVIQKGWMSAQQLRVFGLCSLALGILFGVPAFLQYPLELIGIGSLAVFGVFAYSNKPFEMKYRALGDFLIFVLLGPILALGASVAVFGKSDLSVVLLGCFFGFLSWTVLHANNLQDIEWDRSHQIKTLASIIGFYPSRYLLVSLYGLAFLSLGIGVGIHGLLIVLGLPFLIQVLRQVFKASGPVSALLIGVRSNSQKLQILFGILLIAGLALSF